MLLGRPGENLDEHSVMLFFIIARREWNGLDMAFLEMQAGNIGLQTPDGDFLQGLLIDCGTSGESAGIDHLKQSRKRFGVAIVRSRRQEQAMLTMLGKPTNRFRTLRIHRIAAHPAR